MNTIRNLTLPAFMTVIIGFAFPVWADLGTVFGPWRYYAPYYFPPQVTQEGTCFTPDQLKPRYQDPNPIPQIPRHPAPTLHNPMAAPLIQGLPIMPAPGPACAPQVPCLPAGSAPTAVYAPPVAAPCLPMGMPFPHPGLSMPGPMPVPYGPEIHPQPISPRHFGHREAPRSTVRSRAPRSSVRPRQERREKAEPEFPSSESGTPRMVPGRPYPVYRSVPKRETDVTPDSSIQRIPRRSGPPNGAKRVTHVPPSEGRKFDPPHSPLRRAVFSEFDD